MVEARHDNHRARTADGRHACHSGNDDLSLPRATVQKIIGEILTPSPTSSAYEGMSFAKDSRDLLIECCVEFITMISSEANEIAEKDAKKTIACEHITKALEELGFSDYVPDLLEVAAQFKQTQAVSLCRPACRPTGDAIGADCLDTDAREETKQD